MKQLYTIILPKTTAEDLATNAMAIFPFHSVIIISAARTQLVHYKCAMFLSQSKVHGRCPPNTGREWRRRKMQQRQGKRAAKQVAKEVTAEAEGVNCWILGRKGSRIKSDECFLWPYLHPHTTKHNTNAASNATICAVKVINASVVEIIITEALSLFLWRMSGVHSMWTQPQNGFIT